MKQETHPLASEEFLGAIDWYGASSKAKAERYRLAVGRHIGYLLSGLLEGPVYEGLPGVRRMLVKDFPYCIIYRRRDDVFEIIAFAHTSRRPGYWKKRL